MVWHAVADRQPAEEIGAAARAMLDDGLYKRSPVPDYNLAFHVSPDLPAGLPHERLPRVTVKDEYHRRSTTIPTWSAGSCRSWKQHSAKQL